MVNIIQLPAPTTVNASEPTLVERFDEVRRQYELYEGAVEDLTASLYALEDGADAPERVRDAALNLACGMVTDAHYVGIGVDVLLRLIDGGKD